MATYETTKSAAVRSSAGPGLVRQPVEEFVSLNLSTAMIDNANDDIGLFYVPAGAVILGCTVSGTDMDSNGTPALAIDIGDSGDEDRLIAGATVGQAATLSSALAVTGHLYKYTARTQIRAYIKTAAATAVAGTLNVSIRYVVDSSFAALTPA